MLPQVREWLSRPKQLCIGGRWQGAASGQTFDTYDPATDEVITSVAHGEATEIERAVTDARRAFQGEWSLWTPADPAPSSIERYGDGASS